MDSLELDTDDFDTLYKLHTGHHVFNESDDGSSISETESKGSDIYKPPLLTYEELTSNLVDYKPKNQENEYTNEPYSNEVQIRDTIINKELEKLISKTYCQICNIHNQTEHNIASHIRGQLHKNKLEEYRRNRWIYVSKDERSESGSVHMKSYPSNKVVAPSNPGDIIINKELEKLVLKTSCHICNLHNQTEHNIASHIRGQPHKNKLEEYRRNRWTDLSKDARSVQQSHESGSVFTKSHTSNKVVAPSNPDTCKLLEEVIQEKLKKLALLDYCYICEANLEQPLNADSHYRSKRHKDNLKLWKCEELSKIKCSMKSEVTKFPKHPAQDVDEKSTTKTGIVQNTSTKSSMNCYICGQVDNRKDHYLSQQHLSGVEGFCFTCNLQTMSKKQLSEHMKGTKHMNKIKQIQKTDIPKSTGTSSDNIVKSDDGTIIQGTFHYGSKKSLPDATNLKMEICAVCNLRFSDSVMAKAHYSTENHKLNAKKSVPPKWCYCEICKIPLDGTEKSEDHYIFGAHIAKTIKVFSCKLCNLSFYAEEPLQEHKRSFPHCYLINLKHDLVSRGVTSQFWYVLKETKVECTLCGIYMMSPSNATSHLNSRRHLDSLDNWVCEQITDVKNPNIRWYYCYICDVKLDGTTLVELHYQGKSHLQKKREIGENSTKPKDITQQVSAEASKDALENSKKTKCDSSDYLEAPLSLNGITSPLSGDLEVNSMQTIDSLKTMNDLEETTNFSCYLCNVQFVSKVELLAHKKDYPHSQLQILKKDLIINGIASIYWSVSNEKDIICLLCNSTLRASSSAQQHIQSSKHSKKYADWLEKQVKNTEDVNRRRYYCDVCAIDLDGTSDAERHYQGNYHIENLSGCNKNMQWFLGGVEQEGDLASLPEEIKDNASDLLNETNNKDQVTSYVAIEIEEPIEDVPSENYNFKCYLCKMEFKSQDDLWEHCKIFPHKHVINMKSYIVSKGISRTEYWTTTDLSVNCILCSVNLQNDSAVNGHLNSKKHNSRLNTWLKNLVADTMDPNRKWFYCDVCNVNLDGTSNAENHDKEESHIRRINGTSDSEGPEVRPTNCTESGSYPGSSVVRNHSDIVVVKPNTGEIHEETILLKDEVLSELEEFTDIIYFSKRIPLRVALNMLKKYNEELRKLELTNTIENQLSNFPIRPNASLEVKPDVLNNGKFYKAFAENSIENSLTFSDYYCFNVDRYETYSNLYEGNTVDYYTYNNIPDRSNKVNPFIDPSPKKPSMLRTFAWGIAGLFLVYLLKRKIWK